MDEATRRMLGGLLLVSVPVIWAVAQWQRTTDAPIHRQRAREWLIVLASLYPLGKGCQQLTWGPPWVRFYVGDAGFVAAFACAACFSGALLATVLGWSAPPLRPWQHRRLARKMAYLGWLLAVGVEMWTLAIQPAKSTIPFSARGDEIDLVIYCVTLLVTLALIQVATDKPQSAKQSPPQVAASHVPRLQRGAKPPKRHRR